MKTVISIKVDKDVRDKARRTAKSMGLPLSTVVNRQLREFAETQRIEFRAPLVPNARTRKIIDEARREHAAGKTHSFGNARDAIKWLKSGR